MIATMQRGAVRRSNWCQPAPLTGSGSIPPDTISSSGSGLRGFKCPFPAEILRVVTTSSGTFGTAFDPDDLNTASLTSDHRMPVAGIRRITLLPA